MQLLNDKAWMIIPAYLTLKLLCTLSRNVRILEKKYIYIVQCYIKKYEKDALQEKERVRGSVEGIFQTGGMIGIETLKFLGSEDRPQNRGVYLTLEENHTQFFNAELKGQVKCNNWRVWQKPDPRGLACFHKGFKLCLESSEEPLENFKTGENPLCV